MRERRKCQKNQREGEVVEQKGNINDTGLVSMMIPTLRYSRRRQVALVLCIVQVATAMIDSNSSNPVCIICNCREPPIIGLMVFPVDCDSCGHWAHMHSAMGSNIALRSFICASCAKR